MSNLHDNNLTPEEQQLQSAVRGLGELRAADEFRARLRRQFVSGEFAATAVEPAVAEPFVMTPPRRRRPWARAAIPVAALAMAASLAVVFLGGADPAWQLHAVRGEGMVTVNGVAVDPADRQALAQLIGSNARLVVPAGVELDVVLDEVMVLGVVGPADFVLPAAPNSEPYEYEAFVHAGEFRLKTGPDFPGRQVLMRTTEGWAEITGTTVAVFKNADVTCVCVLEGTARVFRQGGEPDSVPAGMRKVMFSDGREPMIIAIEPGHERSLLDFEGHNWHTFGPHQGDR